jgi:hypothetical protein
VTDWSDTAMVGFAFGSREDPRRGTNAGLAWMVRDMCRGATSVPRILLQPEVAECVSRTKHPSVAYESMPVRRSYVDTMCAATWFASVLRGKDRVRQVVLVAHPDHVRRCRDALRRAGVRATIVVPPCVVPWRQCGCDRQGYDPLSAQAWTTNRHAYLRHERRVRTEGR